MTRWIIVFLICLGKIGLGATNPIDTFFVHGANAINISNYLQCYFDETNAIREQNAAQLFYQKKFTKIYTDETYNFGNKYGSAWMAICVKNTAPHRLNLYWSFYSHSINVNLFHFDKDSLLFLSNGNMHNTLENRPAKSRSVSFPIALEKDSAALLMVKISPTNIEHLNFSTDITTDLDNVEWELFYAIKIIPFFTFFVLAFLFNMLLFFITKNKLHLWHSLYILSIFFVNLYEFHFDSYFFSNPIIYYYFSLNNQICWGVFALLFALKLIIQFVDMKGINRRLYYMSYYYFYVLLSLNVVLFFATLFLPIEHVFSQIIRDVQLYITYLTLLFLVVLIIWCMLKKIKQIYYYIFSSILVYLSAVLYFLSYHNLIDFSFYPTYSLIIGLSFEIFVFTGIIVYQYMTNRKIEVELQKKLLNDIIYTQENERTRFSKDLHDDLGGYLALAKMKADTIDADLASLIGQSYQKLRTIVYGLMPPRFDEEGLCQSIVLLIEMANSIENIAINFKYTGDDKKLNHEQNIICYRIITELLSNSIKHSHASIIDIDIAIEKSAIILTFHDNGIGFDTKKIKYGLGLDNISNRVNYLNGTMKISTNKTGSTFFINLPLI